MKAEKRTWPKPQLCVLVRTRAEEAVLLTCKTTGSAAMVNNWQNGCNQQCVSDCATWVTS